jgi:hypothetical protein
MRSRAKKHRYSPKKPASFDIHFGVNGFSTYEDAFRHEKCKIIIKENRMQKKSISRHTRSTFWKPAKTRIGFCLSIADPELNTKMR